jgi:DNA-binding MarR family transcriptional regulator
MRPLRPKLIIYLLKQTAGLPVWIGKNEAGLNKHPAHKSIGFQLRLAARLHRTRMAELLHDIGLHPGQDQALQLLGEGAANMGEIAHALRIRPPTASKTIARLIQQGLVSRQTTSGDARVVTISLTPEGQEKLIAINAMAQMLEGEIEALFDQQEIKRLRKALRRIGDSLQAQIKDKSSPDHPSEPPSEP